MSAPDDASLISAFLATAAAEQGVAENTLLSYGRDLKDFSAHLAHRGNTLEGADRAAIEDYLVSCEAAGWRPRPARAG